ncbi:MAG: extracellular solute-binding protein [Chloroflexota bacterium]
MDSSTPKFPLTGLDRPLTRRRLLVAALVSGAGALAACAPAASPAATTAPKPVETAKPAATAAASAAASPAAAATKAATTAPVAAGAKPFAGVTLNGAMFEHTYSAVMKEQLPEFEKATGMKVNLELTGMPVFTQRADLELSTKGSAYDFLCIAFAWSGRWVGAGWFADLEPYIKDANKTPKDWEADDFGLTSPFKDAKGTRFGFPWIAEVMVQTVARPDIIQQAGLKIPTTYEEMAKVMAATHNKDGVAAYVAAKHHHWFWPPILFGFGGKVFKDPPDNLTPTLDTPEAIEAAEYYGNILRSYGVEGVLSYVDDQMVNAQVQGRANISMHTLSWTMPVCDPAKSKVADKVIYAPLPAGPKGYFPGVGANGLGIPLGSKQKDAAWEFMKWAVGKELIWKMVREKNYTSPARLSVLNSAEFKKKLTVNGVDLPALATKVMEAADKGGYMKYRTTTVFPQMTDKLNKVIETIATKQMSAKDAMKQAQTEAVADLKKAGIKIDA